MLRQTKTRKSAITKRAKKHSTLSQLQAGFQRLGLRFLVLAVALWAFGWFALSGGIHKTQNWVVDNAVLVMADAGFSLKNIYVEGRENTDSGLLMALINAEQGMPLFSLDPHKIRDALSSIAWIKTVSVKRVFPDSLYIVIEERKPAAFLLEDKKLQLIDRSGYVITSKNIERFKDLLIISGDGAPDNVSALLSTIEGAPEVAVRLDQARFVSGRRWDLVLQNKVTVNLPEKDVALALQRLLKAHEQDDILDKKIKNIDVRQQDRLIIKAYPGAAQQSYSLINNKGAPI
jgi:cell division protein FtsQ